MRKEPSDEAGGDIAAGPGDEAELEEEPADPADLLAKDGFVCSVCHGFL